MRPYEADPWLDRWWAELSRRCVDGDLLELGCGTGDDTEQLVGHGLRVTAVDISEPALETLRARCRPVATLQHDLSKPLPFAPRSFQAVVASLSLHYFDWETTRAILQDIRRCLVSGGLLLCRLNSTGDVLHGAGRGTEVEPNFYRQDAVYSEYKRFFSAADLDRAFPAGEWQELSRQEGPVLRYGAPKVAWELALLAR